MMRCNVATHGLLGSDFRLICSNLVIDKARLRPWRYKGDKIQCAFPSRMTSPKVENLYNTKIAAFHASP